MPVASPTIAWSASPRVRRDQHEHHHDAGAQQCEVHPREHHDQQRVVAHDVPSGAVCDAMRWRMSRIGSTDRTRGMTSKLCGGGGEVVNHSSVLAFHGSGPAAAAAAQAPQHVQRS